MAPTASLRSKEICEANTTIMCPMCEDTCKPWTLSDSCVFAKVGALLEFFKFALSNKPNTQHHHPPVQSHQKEKELFSRTNQLEHKANIKLE